MGGGFPPPVRMGGVGRPGSAASEVQTAAGSQSTVAQAVLQPGNLWVKATPEKELVDTNRVYVSAQTMAQRFRARGPVQVQVEKFVFLAEVHPQVEPESIALNAVHRKLVRAEVRARAPRSAPRFLVDEMRKQHRPPAAARCRPGSRSPWSLSRLRRPRSSTRSPAPSASTSSRGRWARSTRSRTGRPWPR